MKKLLKSSFWECLGYAFCYLLLGLVGFLFLIPKLIISLTKFIIKSTFGWLVGLIIVVGLVVGIVLLIVL